MEQTRRRPSARLGAENWLSAAAAAGQGDVYTTAAPHVASDRNSHAQPVLASATPNPPWGTEPTLERAQRRETCIPPASIASAPPWATEHDGVVSASVELNAAIARQQQLQRQQHQQTSLRRQHSTLQQSTNIAPILADPEQQQQQMLQTQLQQLHLQQQQQQQRAPLPYAISQDWEPLPSKAATHNGNSRPHKPLPSATNRDVDSGITRTPSPPTRKGTPSRRASTLPGSNQGNGPNQTEPIRPSSVPRSSGGPRVPLPHYKAPGAAHAPNVPSTAAAGSLLSHPRGNTATAGWCTDDPPPRSSLLSHLDPTKSGSNDTSHGSSTLHSTDHEFGAGPSSYSRLHPNSASAQPGQPSSFLHHQPQHQPPQRRASHGAAGATANTGSNGSSSSNSRAPGTPPVPSISTDLLPRNSLDVGFGGGGSSSAAAGKPGSTPRPAAAAASPAQQLSWQHSGSTSVPVVDTPSVECVGLPGMTVSHGSAARPKNTRMSGSDALLQLEEENATLKDEILHLKHILGVAQAPGSVSRPSQGATAARRTPQATDSTTQAAAGGGAGGGSEACAGGSSALWRYKAMVAQLQRQVVLMSQEAEARGRLILEAESSLSELGSRLAEVCGPLAATRGTSGGGGGGGGGATNRAVTAAFELAQPDTPLTADQCAALGDWGKHMLSRLRGERAQAARSLVRVSGGGSGWRSGSGLGGGRVGGAGESSLSTITPDLPFVPAGAHDLTPQGASPDTVPAGGNRFLAPHQPAPTLSELALGRGALLADPRLTHGLELQLACVVPDVTRLALLLRTTVLPAMPWLAQEAGALMQDVGSTAQALADLSRGMTELCALLPCPTPATAAPAAATAAAPAGGADVGWGAGPEASRRAALLAAGKDAWLWGEETLPAPAPEAGNRSAGSGVQPHSNGAGSQTVGELQPDWFWKALQPHLKDDPTKGAGKNAGIQALLEQGRRCSAAAEHRRRLVHAELAFLARASAESARVVATVVRVAGPWIGGASRTLPAARPPAAMADASAAAHALTQVLRASEALQRRPSEDAVRSLVEAVQEGRAHMAVAPQILLQLVGDGPSSSCSRPSGAPSPTAHAQDAARSALAVIRSRFEAAMVHLQQQQQQQQQQQAAAQHATDDPRPNHRQSTPTPQPSALKTGSSRQRPAAPAEGAGVERRSSAAGSNAAAAAVVASQLPPPFRSGVHARSPNPSLNPSDEGGASDPDPAARGSPTQRASPPRCVLERGHPQLNSRQLNFRQQQQQQQQDLEAGWRQGGAGDSDTAGDNGNGTGDRTARPKRHGSDGDSSGAVVSRRPTSASRRVSFASETATD
ncbi:MAG: hypothetical protein WDW36_004998 [Sanguina aurantia]